ncbi:hypothetical protein JI741_25515 [Chryseolinea sp. Jin1]|uniref:SMP-30/Gluconolactonase/LRE-like region domain-containing protein n=1 Tax=Chryseolinea lacunae TaxID=2801331 RepID=A0ABS1KZC1_9BACT|nr:hypothetical protein [Chryseolinea lacunae]
MFVTDVEGHTIRKITPAGLVTTLAGAWGLADGPGHEAKFKNPFGLAFDAAGNLYIADRTNNRIRKMNSVNVVSTFAGSAAGYA